MAAPESKRRCWSPSDRPGIRWAVGDPDRSRPTARRRGRQGGTRRPPKAGDSVQSAVALLRSCWRALRSARTGTNARMGRPVNSCQQAFTMSRTESGGTLGNWPTSRSMSSCTARDSSSAVHSTSITLSLRSNSLQRHPNGDGCSRLLRGVLPEERVSLDSDRETEAPDRSAGARVDAFLPWPVEVRAIKQLDDRCVVGDPSLAGQDSRGAGERHARERSMAGLQPPGPVSYTHLTLPTKRIV